MVNEKRDHPSGIGLQIETPLPEPDEMGLFTGIIPLNLPQPLTLEEKKYLLAVERGDLATVRRILQKAHRKQHININCMDPLGRRALTLSIDSENLEMVELLIVMGVETKDALLQAINAGFVEAVELLLEHEELIHIDGELYSWQKVEASTAMFTPDITPLILAGHKNNYEILKLLLDRGACVPIPHDIRCGCEECIRLTTEDPLRHSLSRVNMYKALASPSLISLTSNDPLMTAFQLSWELRNLAFTEQECKSEYLELRSQCQKFVVDLLDQTRNSKELAIILNYDPLSPPYEEGDRMSLARLELAIKYKQKKFVAHPNIQQLLASIWYEGVPGFRRKKLCDKFQDIIRVAILFPLYCITYMIAPNCSTGKLMRKPFMKFLIHASSYLFFLFILILVSQRAEDDVIKFFGTEDMRRTLNERMKRHRGNGPTGFEMMAVIYVIGFVWEEVQEIYTIGIRNYLRNMWNFIDFTRNGLYISVFCLRIFAYIQQSAEISQDPQTAFIARENWNSFDPQLIAEGLFAAANIFSALKLVHLFSINPHLGPLQISLGRMVIDIVKFFFIYTLVLFAFACGLNQLLWYFADLEKLKCYSLPNDEPDWAHNGDSCMKWRRFGNLFESSQSLFWASFGMVGLENFELQGIKSYTRFWGLLMFGSYSVINVIVLLNLLIAMMSNSYAMIEQHSDTEWKFARTKLWMSYFEDSATLPSPFNIFPSVKWLIRIFRKSRKELAKKETMKRQEAERENHYINIMRALVWRYVCDQHRKCEESAVTEDDINEVKGEVSTMRYEMLEIFKRNGMDVSSASQKEKPVRAKRAKIWERRLMKDFQVAPIPSNQLGDEDDSPGGGGYNSSGNVAPPHNEDPKSKFRRIARQVANDSIAHKWNILLQSVAKDSQIGRCCNREMYENQKNLQKAIQEAQRLIMTSPLPQTKDFGHDLITGSTTTSNMTTAPAASSTLLNLLNNMSEELKKSQKSITFEPQKLLKKTTTNPSKLDASSNSTMKDLITTSSQQQQHQLSTVKSPCKTVNEIFRSISPRRSAAATAVAAAVATATGTTKGSGGISSLTSSQIAYTRAPGTTTDEENDDIDDDPKLTTNVKQIISQHKPSASSHSNNNNNNNYSRHQQKIHIAPEIKLTKPDCTKGVILSASSLSMNKGYPIVSQQQPQPHSTSSKGGKKAPPPPPGAASTILQQSSDDSSSHQAGRLFNKNQNPNKETEHVRIQIMNLNDSTERLMTRADSPSGSDISSLPPLSPRGAARLAEITMVPRKSSGGWL